MKKLLTLIVALGALLSINAQTIYFQETFNGGTISSPPMGFTVVNNDICFVNNPTIFPNNSWVVYEDGTDTFASAQSWSTQLGCTSDDWLITPAIDLTSATGTIELNWRAQSFEGGASGFPESYEVLLSTTGVNAPADFTTTLFSIAQEEDLWTSRSVDLSSFVGQTVYLAYRMTSSDMSQLWIDDISVRQQAQADLQLVSFQSDATPQKTALNANTNYAVLDFSGTSLFNASVTVENTGISSVDTISVNYFIVDDIQAPTAGSIVTKDFPQNPPLPAGSQTTLTLDAIGLDTLFPTLATNQALNLYVELDSTQYNQVLDVNDGYFSFLINPREAYTAPYSSSFEWVVGGTSFSFEHADWGWKFIDADASGGSHYVQGFTNFANYDGDYMVFSALTPPNSLALGNAGDYFETPELSLTAGSYIVGLWGRGGFGFESVLNVELVNGNGATSPISQFSSTIDTVNFTQNTAIVNIPSTADDYKIRFVDAGGGFGVWDFMTLDPLAAPVASGVISGTDETNPFIDYCDGTIILTNTSAANGGTCTVNWGDGAATAIASGASLQHTYAANGTYTITLTATNFAGSNQVTFNVVIADPPALDASFTIVDQGSGNVSIQLSNPHPCGGVQTTVNWGDGTSNNSTNHTYTADGTYTITVTVQTTTDIAQSTGSVTISTTPLPCPNPITASASITPDTCGQNTGAIAVTTAGGSGQIFFQWSPGGFQTSTITGLSAGSYSVQITDITGCDTTISYSVPSVNPAFTLSTSSTEEACGCDGTASVSVNGNGSFTYQWDDVNQQNTSTANNLCAGSYTVVVSDGSGCSSTATVVVGAAPTAVSVSVTSSPQTDATNPDGSVSAFVSGGTPPYSYLWSNGSTDAIVTGLAAGSYTVDVSDANGCSGSASVTIEADIDTSTSILSMNWQEVVLSPNPSSGDIQIQWTSQQSIPYTITLVDASGRQMMSSQGHSVQGANALGMATSTLSPGLYQVIIESRDTQVLISLTITR